MWLTLYKKTGANMRKLLTERAQGLEMGKFCLRIIRTLPKKNRNIYLNTPEVRHIGCETNAEKESKFR